MTVLEELLESVKDDDSLNQMLKMCDTITKEEKSNIENHHLVIKGSNVFLCLEVPGRTQREIAFLVLEREIQDSYIAVLWTYQKSQIEAYLKGKDKDLKGEYSITPRRSKVWIIEQDDPLKILTEYAKIIKYLKGE